MNNYKFTKSDIKNMYNQVVSDCYENNDLTIKIKIGDHQIEIPVNADFIDIIFKAIEECEKEDL